jgi:hypothetical protein
MIDWWPMLHRPESPNAPQRRLASEVPCKTRRYAFFSCYCWLSILVSLSACNGLVGLLFLFAILVDSIVVIAALKPIELTAQGVGPKPHPEEPPFWHLAA